MAKTKFSPVSANQQGQRITKGIASGEIKLSDYLLNCVGKDSDVEDEDAIVEDNDNDSLDNSNQNFPDTSPPSPASKNSDSLFSSTTGVQTPLQVVGPNEDSSSEKIADNGTPDFLVEFEEKENAQENKSPEKNLTELGNNLEVFGNQTGDSLSNPVEVTTNQENLVIVDTVGISLDEHFSREHRALRDPAASAAANTDVQPEVADDSTRKRLDNKLAADKPQGPSPGVPDDAEQVNFVEETNAGALLLPEHRASSVPVALRENGYVPDDAGHLTDPLQTFSASVTDGTIDGNIDPYTTDTNQETIDLSALSTGAVSLLKFGSPFGIIGLQVINESILQLANEIIELTSDDDNGRMILKVIQNDTQSRQAVIKVENQVKEELPRSNVTPQRTSKVTAPKNALVKNLFVTESKHDARSNAVSRNIGLETSSASLSSLSESKNIQCYTDVSESHVVESN
ncbi:hypothetical protein QAD02_008325 [Eretmocerus hayati]|uniref:Uncharacterized protein n=1 Tax=Eretmocerus hayati TaxID=131215 RepID=A0ACC2N7H3_9HYME|nr:hypothetical protein QAD02_008325 [Eretmocerus hayati]